MAQIDPDDAITSMTPTDINWLAIPVIFATGLLPDNSIHTSSYTYGSTSVSVTTHLPLRPHDRKTLVALERLYYLKAPQNDILSFTLGELASELGVAPNNFDFLYASLDRLYHASVAYRLRFKAPAGLTQEQIIAAYGLSDIPLIQPLVDDDSSNSVLVEAFAQFHILTSLSGIASGSSHLLSVTFNRWHIANFKSKYYRLVDISQYRSVRSPLALFLLDFLASRAYYRDKRGVYRMKSFLSIPYSELSAMAGIKAYSRASDIRKQLRPLQDLVSVGAISAYELLIGNDSSFCVKLALANGPALHADASQQQSGLYNDLLSFGLLPKQCSRVMQQFGVEYLVNKLAQAVFVQANYPNAFGQYSPQSYLYNAILSNWCDPRFDSYKANQARRAIQDANAEQASAERNVSARRAKQHSAEATQYLAGLSDEAKDMLIQELSAKYPRITQFMPREAILGYASLLAVDDDPASLETGHASA